MPKQRIVDRLVPTRVPAPAPPVVREVSTGVRIFWAAFVWFCALTPSFVHVAVLTVVARHVAGDLVMYAVLAAPALILLVVRPRETVRYGYRWLVVWALAFTSIVGSVTLLAAQAWVLRQTWLESGRTLRWTRRPGGASGGSRTRIGHPRSQRTCLTGAVSERCSRPG